MAPRNAEGSFFAMTDNYFLCVTLLGTGIMGFLEGGG